MAATLFADPPQATMEEARDHFMEAERLKPDGWKENRQFLAKTFIHLKDYKTALQWLDKANEVPVKNPDVSRLFSTDSPPPIIASPSALFSSAQQNFSDS